MGFLLCQTSSRGRVAWRR